MSTSRLDAIYRSLLLTKFFTKGWGKPENLRRLFEFRKVVSNRDECFKLIDRDYPVTITKEQQLSDCRLLEGYFMSPLEKFLPGIVPEVAQKAYFQAVIPLKWPDPQFKPMCLHLAGTGDHFFWRRRNLMVRPLMKESGIGGIILENPFYGLRKPVDQYRSSLHNVSDIFVMGGCLILESLVLFHWCERNGLGPLGVTGLSMGGHMASLAATNWPKPIVLVPCLSWSTASAVFLQGVMSHSINWDLLEDQYLSDGQYREKLSKMVTIVDEAFLAGKKFAQSISINLENTKKRMMSTTVENVDTKIENSKENVSENKENINKVQNNPNTLENKSDPNSNLSKMVVLENKKENESYQNILANLDDELRRLLDEGKINKQLYEKLTSNEKFALEPQDIEQLNKLNINAIQEAILKCKVAHVKAPTARLEIEETKEIPFPADLKVLKSSLSKDIEKDIPRYDLKTEKKQWNTSDLWANLPQLPFYKPKNDKKIDISKIHWRDRETLQFMRGIMDECTHLSNFSVPYDTSLIIAVCAKHDAYVPRDDVGALEEIWPGATVRYVDAGHVAAYILHQSMFRSCIKEAFEKSKKRWKDGRHIE